MIDLVKRFIQPAVLVLLLALAPAHAFTSLYASVNVAGTFNGYNTTATPLALVSDNVWRTSIDVGGMTNVAFLFVTNGSFNTTWKVNTQPVQPFPVSGTSVLNSGSSDIALTGVFSGTLTFQLDTATRVYTVDYAEGPWTSRYEYVNLAGSFNGFETLNTNMVLVSNGIWQGYAQVSTPATNPTFVFATRNFTNSWKESNQSVFALPLSGTAEYNAGSDISINGTFTGTLRFEFNERTGAYRVENVTAGSQPTDVWINEIHYENAGDDLNDSIEFAGPAGTDLTNYWLVAYNGGDGKSYSTNRLKGIIPDQQNGMGVVWTNLKVNGLQNGPTDAVALVKSGTNVLFFLGYEGSFTAVNGPAAGMTSVDIGVRESDSISSNFSLQVTGTGAQYSDFTWTGPISNTLGSINAGQVLQAGSPAASLAFSNLVHAPASPLTSDVVYVEVDISPLYSASNLQATTFYRLNSSGLYRPLAMSRTGTHFRTYRPIPAQPSGSTVDYYVFVNYSGTGTNAPQVYPSNAPPSSATYGVSAVGAGFVWINEINPTPDLFEQFSTTSDYEYIELAGVAGSDLSGWSLEITDLLTNPWSTIVIPEGAVLPNDTNGIGLFVIGDDPEVAHVRLPFGTTNVNDIPSSGTMQLLNEFGVVQQAIYWTTDYTTNLPGYTPAGEDHEFFGYAYGLGLTGNGGALSNFAWLLSYEPETPGLANESQDLFGGNTNPLPPTILCPSNVYYACLSTPVPTVNVASVTATGLCAGGAVTVTHAGDVTNSGSGCAGSPKIITRTYRAVSACATTSTCSQLIVYEDADAPVLTLVGGTQQLVNASFESGSLQGWTPFGALSNQVYAAVQTPYLGFGHAVIEDPAALYAEDDTGNGFDARIRGAPLRGAAAQPVVNTLAYTFDGVDDHLEIPYSSALNPTSAFSFSVWVRCDTGTNAVRAVLGTGTNRGFALYQTASNTWRFSTGTGSGTHDSGGPSTYTTASVHLVGCYSASNQSKRFYVNGTLVASSTVAYAANNANPLRVAALPVGTSSASNFFDGRIDDVKLFDRALGVGEVNALYNGGNGSHDANDILVHLKLDEPAYVTNTFAGIHQGLPALSGQTWSVSAYLQSPAGNPVSGANRAVLELQFLNNTTVVQAVTSQPVNASTPSNVYYRYTASAQATQTVTEARALVRYLRGSDVAGSVYVDAFTLSRFAFDPGSNCTFTLSNLLVNVSASDACSVVSTTQTPTAGTALGVGDHDVVFAASDGCGQIGYATIRVSVVDSKAPVLTVSNLTIACEAQLTATTGVTVTDCGDVSTLVVGETLTGGNGCSMGEARITTRVLQAVDSAGFVSYATQVVSQVSTTPPSISVSQTGALVNAGYETGSFSPWSRYGNAFLNSQQPRSGSYCARVAGQNTGSINYNGFYQDVAARSGQHWRAAAWLISIASEAMAGANSAVVKLEYLDAASQIVGTYESSYFTSNNVVEAHYLLSAQGVAPSNTAWARFSLVFTQPAMAAGSVRVDDMVLTQTHLTSVGGAAVLPDLLQLPVSSNTCSQPVVTQNPPAGGAVPAGVTNIQFIAVDTCGRISTTTVALVGMDDTVESLAPPVPTNVVVQGVTFGGTNVVVRSLGTNSWSVVSEYSTNLRANPVVWTVISNRSTTFSGGTNTTTFGVPVTNAMQGVIIRVRQTYP